MVGKAPECRLLVRGKFTFIRDKFNNLHVFSLYQFYNVAK